MRIVLDTGIVIAGLRSKTGVSRRILQMVYRRQITALATVGLLIEYASVLKRPEHLEASNLTLETADNFINALAQILEPVEPHFAWRPQLKDPSDEMVLEAAVNGQARYIITFNMRDFGQVPQHFGIEALTPVEFLGRLKQ